MTLELLSPLKAQTLQSRTSEFVELHVPNGLNLMEDAEYASQAALWGIEGLPELGEIHPLGGAGDRLGLVDPVTGECLPAALLPYCGRTLLEGLIRDLQNVKLAKTALKPGAGNLVNVIMRNLLLLKVPYERSTVLYEFLRIQTGMQTVIQAGLLKEGM